MMMMSLMICVTVGTEIAVDSVDVVSVSQVKRKPRLNRVDGMAL
jgi:hypothetical protein